MTCRLRPGNGLPGRKRLNGLPGRAFLMRSRKDSPAELPSPHAIRPRLWHPEAETTRIVPFISVLVPVRNEGRCIAATLIKLLHQRYDSNRYEVIVADGESGDDTCAQVRTLQARH